MIGEIEALGDQLRRVRESIGRVIFGQQEVVDQTLITLLAGGHALVIGVPGLAKTRLVETLGTVFGVEDKRVQCTPDLMPADIIGSEVLEESEDGRRSFRFIPGPVFCQLLMADEINRASPRTQSALLQAMQEHRVTVAGQVPRPAPAVPRAGDPESRWSRRAPIPCRRRSSTASSWRSTSAIPTWRPSARCCSPPPAARSARPSTVMNAEELMHAQRLVRRVPVGDGVVQTILDLVRNGRPDSTDLPEVEQQVAWGPGPRATQALMLAVRARALLDGRFAPSVDDVVALAGPVLRHRMAINFGARADGVTIDDVIERLAAPFR